jgi:hypothetical protein
MNRDRKIAPDEAWDAVERMALDDEAKRIESLSAGALDAELDRQGFDPQALRARGAALAARLAKGGNASEAQDVSGPVPKLRAIARPWAHARAIAWTAGAALAAAALAAIAMNRTDGVVVNRDIGPDTLDGDIAKKPDPSPKEVATKLRYEAYDLCDSTFWAACEKKLDEAKNLDPAGESGLGVQAARQAVSEGLMRDGGPDMKPPKPRVK